jgi:hypothetical protein
MRSDSDRGAAGEMTSPPIDRGGERRPPSIALSAKKKCEICYLKPNRKLLFFHVFSSFFPLNVRSRFAHLSLDDCNSPLIYFYFKFA